MNKLFFVILFFAISFVAVSKEIDIKGIDDEQILSLIRKQISIDKDDIKNSEDSISIKYKLEQDEELIETLLKSYGYFDCEVKSEIVNKRLKILVTLNERYKLNNMTLRYNDTKYFSGITVKEVFELINLDFDSYVTTKEILSASTKIKDFLKSKGFAFVSTSTPELKIDKNNKKIAVIYNITLNGKVIIDKTVINIKGKQNSQSLLKFVKNRILWKDGEVYDIGKINNTRDYLMGSGIFSGIEIILSDPKKDPFDKMISHVVLKVNLEEALLRDIAAGAKFGTSEKFGVLLSWSHYNIDGKGSKLTTILDIAKKDRTVKLKHDLYDLFYKRQLFGSQIFYNKENTSAYNVTKVGIEEILWQEFSKGFKVGIGGCVEDAKTIDKVVPSESKIKFNGFGIPIGIMLDSTDSFLDPQKGLRCSGTVTPYFGNIKNMAVMSGKASVYLPISKNSFQRPLVIALFMKVGSIIRDEKERIPRDRLFFRGGSDSIRGYGYQKLGPVNDNKKALGGRSFVEFGLEPRIKINEDLGVVAFFEGGNVFSTRVPKVIKKMLFGYGAGIRYYTQLGPIRFDIAFPTKRRKTSFGKKIDSMFNIYLSVGQAF